MIFLVKPVGDHTFWNIIDNVLKKKWTSNFKPYICELCEKGPTYSKTLEALSDDKANRAIQILSIKHDLAELEVDGIMDATLKENKKKLKTENRFH